MPYNTINIPVLEQNLPEKRHSQLIDFVNINTDKELNRLFDAENVQYIQQATAYKSLLDATITDYKTIDVGDTQFNTDDIKTQKGSVNPIVIASNIETWLGPGQARYIAGDIYDELVDEKEISGYSLEYALSYYLEKHLVGTVKEIDTEPTDITLDMEGLKACVKEVYDNYLGQYLVLVNPQDIAEYLFLNKYLSITKDKDDRLYTFTGSPIVISSAVEARTVYVTGHLTIHKSQVLIKEAPDLPTNKQTAQCQQAFSIIVDGQFAKQFNLINPT